MTFSASEFPNAVKGNRTPNSFVRHSVQTICWSLSVVGLLAGIVQLVSSLDDSVRVWLHKRVSGQTFFWLSIICIGALFLVLILVRLVESRIAAHPSKRLQKHSGRHVAFSPPQQNSSLAVSGAVTSGIIGLVLAVLSLLIASLYPTGVIGRPPTAAPFGSSRQAQEVLEREVATCQTQWLSLGEADVSGISFGLMCPSENVMYAEFFHNVGQEQFMASIDKTGPLLMRNYMSAEQNVATKKYCFLKGTRWVAIVPLDKSENFHHLLGGEISKLE